MKQLGAVGIAVSLNASNWSSRHRYDISPLLADGRRAEPLYIAKRKKALLEIYDFANDEHMAPMIFDRRLPIKRSQRGKCSVVYGMSGDVFAQVCPSDRKSDWRALFVVKDAKQTEVLAVRYPADDTKSARDIVMYCGGLDGGSFETHELGVCNLFLGEFPSLDVRYAVLTALELHMRINGLRTGIDVAGYGGGGGGF